MVSLPSMLTHADGESPVREQTTVVGDVRARLTDLPRLDGISVLVVDDEQDGRRVLKRLLEIRGASVATAASVDEALEVLEGRVPDVILSDIGMPGQDGYDFIRRVRHLSSEHGGETPAAAVTAFARSDDRIRTLRSGFQMHLAKPVDPLELLTAVAALAGRISSHPDLH